MASRSHDFDMNLNIFCLNTSFQDRSMRSVQQFEDLAMLLEMPLYEDLPNPALERLWAVGFLTVEISMPWMPWIWIRMLDFLRWRSMQAPLDRGFYTEFRYVKDVERRARRGENCVIDHPWLGMIQPPPKRMVMTGGWFGGFQFVMEVPKNGWFLLWKIPSRNGWWLGVPLF